MRNRFDTQLKLLNNEMIEMGVLIEQAIANSVSALSSMDTALAKKSTEFDENINRKEREIESLCLQLLLQQQPVARDLRVISSALKMITDMERIGDQAADISEIVLMMSNSPRVLQLSHIDNMAKSVSKMVNDSIDAFVRRDIILAQRVCDEDDVIDGLFETVRSEILELISEDRQNGDQALDLLMIAKYLERIGDHAVNVAEWVAFSITGKHKKGGLLQDDFHC